MIWIVADSAQELKTDRDKGLVVAPLGIIASGEPMEEGFTSEDFYRTQQQKGVTLTTSQVSPAVYMDIFEDLLKNPEDEVIVISLASGLSGSYNSARLAKTSVDEKRIHLIDSQTISFPMVLLVQEALNLRNQGKSAQEIVDILEEDKKKVRLLGLVPTLEYLKRGGRISAATAAIGELAGIKPILTLEEGKIAVPLKVRGMKKAYNSMARLAKEWNIDLDRPVIFGYTGLDSQPAQTLKEAFENQLETTFATDYMEGCYILATHTGPEGAIAGFFVK
ncbi:DegV family protein [Allobaculum stercoricanis]|uniref:DegV family protein n=1 Tax=Allobaculum stercoricanis TaxID=174709 RepID=UPI0003725CAF|nr:DegV family protein [Allobaculum stercoricanis]